MKTRRQFLISICLAAFALRSQATFPFVVETPKEFSTLADFDGDNIPDLIIVDKASGQFRVGYETSGTNRTWTGSLNSGGANLTGFSVGRVNDRFRPLFVSPDDNRVFTTTASSLGLPGKPIFTTGLGASQVAGVDVSGATNDPAVDDVFVTTEFNDGFPGALGEFIRIAGGNFTGTPLGAVNLSAVASAVKRVPIVATPPVTAVALLELNGSRLRLVNAASDTPNIFANGSGLAGATNYTVGFFGGANTATFLCYRPGLFGFSTWRVTDLSASVYGLAPGDSFNLGVSIEQLAALDTTPSQFLALINGGTEAWVFNWDGTNFPAYTQSLAPPSGEKFTAAAVAPGGRLVLNSGTNGISQHTTPWLKSSSNWVAQTTEAVPGVESGDHHANVFLFEQEPFVDPQARLVARLSAADWSTNVALSGGTASAQAQHFGNAAQGLSGTQTRGLGSVPAAAHFGLVNQYRPHISLHSRQSPRGEDTVNVTVNPPSGKFLQAVQPVFTATPTNAVIHWRLAPHGNWQTFNPAALPTIFKNSTLQFYAEDSGAKSAVNSVTYEFDFAPGQLDSDGDGVPDFVELTYGLDPLHSGRDSDGDGFSDLEEIITGTSPTNPASHPLNHPRLDPTFDLRATPFGVGQTDASLFAAGGGTPVTVHDLAGALRSETNVTTFLDGGTNILAAPFNRVPRITDDRLFAVSVASAFRLTNAAPGTADGREVLSLITPPALTAFHLDFNYNVNNGQANETASWLAAAQAAVSAAPVKLDDRESFYSTFAALLVELKLEQVLHARGWSPTNRLTLFPFHAGDAALQSLSLTELAALERPGTNGSPAWSLARLNDSARYTTEHLVYGNGDRFFALAFAYDLYHVSALDTNLTPSPVDALRQFLRTSTVPANYAAADTNLANPVPLATASNGVVQLLAGFTPRGLTNLTLHVAANSFTTAGCQTLFTLGNAPFSLVLADGAPFIFPQGFNLPVGATVQVTGYADMGASPCGGARIEVVTATLTTLPIPSSTDANGNLLPDDWENAFFGGLTDANADADGDGFSNLQELLDGTDPNNAASHGGATVTLSPPVLAVQTSGGLTTLSWEFPAAYASKFVFGAVTTSDLGTSFTPLAVTVTSPSPGHFSITLPAGSPLAQFYRLTMALP